MYKVLKDVYSTLWLYAWLAEDNTWHFCENYSRQNLLNGNGKKVWGFNGIQTHDLRNTSTMLYQLSYEA